MTPILLAFLQDAPAQNPAPSGAMGFIQFVPFILMFAVLWFVMIRPEQKARKKRQEMLAKLAKGDKVMTTGGLFGTVAQIQDDVVTLQVADGVRLRFARSAIQTVESAATGDEKSVEVKTNNA